MDYIKIRFTSEFDQAGSKFEKSVDDMFRSIGPVFSLSERTWKPSMDIYETAEEIIVLAEIAGVDKDDIELEISSKAVRIYGQRGPQTQWGEASFRLAEIQYGKFERILYLPSPIDTEVVSAAYANGMLQVRLAKLKPQTYKIPISDG